MGGYGYGYRDGDSCIAGVGFGNVLGYLVWMENMGWHGIEYKIVYGHRG